MKKAWLDSLTYVVALDQVCALQMDATLTDLAKGLPVFSVKMTHDHTQIISL